MPSSSGTPSSGPKATVVPSAAARYRELHVNRTVYVLGGLALLAPWLAWFLQLQADFGMPSAALAAMGGGTVHGYLEHVLQAFATGGGTFHTFTLLVATALGIALFGYDRAAGGLFYSLETPLRRRDVLGAKALFGGAVVALAVAVGIAGSLAAAALSGNLALAGPILLRGLFDLTGQISLFATALAMGGAMGTVFSCLAAATWAGLPALFAGLLITLFAPPYQAVATPLRLVSGPAAWAIHLAGELPLFSPFNPNGIGIWTPVAVLALVAWFVAWTALMIWQGSRWWERAAFERLHDGVFFPFLWNLYYALLSLGSGLFITTLLTHGSVQGLDWALIYAVLAAAGWFFWRFVITRHGRRAAWRQAVGSGP